MFTQSPINPDLRSSESAQLSSDTPDKLLFHPPVSDQFSGAADQAEQFVEAHHAAPLLPLRERDLDMLADLFRQEEIEQIDADIHKNLRQRYPEPCWEDDPLDFLRDYL